MALRGNHYMRRSLKAETLNLVKERHISRGLSDLSRQSGVSYHILHKLMTGDTKVLDAEICQRLYEHLTGHTLDIR